MMKPDVHVVRIGTSHYFVQGSNTETLKELAGKLKIKYDTIEPSRLSSSQKIIRIWGIGELADYLKTLAV